MIKRARFRMGFLVVAGAMLLGVVVGWRADFQGVRTAVTGRPRDERSGHAVASRVDERLRGYVRAVPRFVDPKPRLRFPGMPVYVPPDPALIFDLEIRDLQWASAMETTLAAMHSAQNLARSGLEAVRVTELSCRQTTCKMVYEFPSKLNRLAASLGLPPGSPLQRLEETVGPPARRGGGHNSVLLFRPDGEPFTRASVVFGFDEDNWNPDGHAAWVDSQLPAVRAMFDDRRKRHAQRRQKPSAWADDAG